MELLTTLLISPDGRFPEGTPLGELPAALRSEAILLGCTTARLSDAQAVAPQVSPAATAPLIEAEPALDLPALMDGTWQSVRSRIQGGDLDTALGAAEALEHSRPDGARPSILKALAARQAGQ